MRTTHQDAFGFNVSAEEQAVENNICVVQSLDGVRFMNIPEGVCPGMHSATKMFSHVYDKNIDSYALGGSSIANMMTAVSPIDSKSLDMSHT
eukprot:2162943-Karenia_brevis.AAC.1